MNNRIFHVDVARGIAILLVVLGHSCLTTDGALNRVILSFHMPLFFFLSGVFAKKLPFNQLLEGALLKSKRILIPQIILGITLIVLKGSIWVAKGNVINDFNFLKCFIYWFLPTLWLCTIIYLLLALLVNFDRLSSKIFSIAVNLLIIYITLNFVDAKGNLYEDLRILPVAFLFYSLGSFTKSITVSLPQVKEMSLFSFMIFLSAPLCFCFSQLNTPVKMYMSDFGNFGFFFITSILGIFLVVEISKRLTNTPLLTWFGKNAIAVYVWNFLVIGVFRVIISRLLSYLGINSDLMLVALTFTSSVLVIYAISFITLRYTPFIYGQRGNKD